MEKKRAAAFFVVCMTIISIAYLEKTDHFIKKEAAIVARVIDGDTLILEDGKRVRLLGINSPERGEFYFLEAKDTLRKLVEGKEVLLKRDLIDKDWHGRLLRHIFVDGIFVNLYMVEKGYANAHFTKPNFKYSSKFFEAEKKAIKEGIGIWRESPYSSCIQLLEFSWLGNERVTFGNVCNFSIEITGWKLKNAGKTVYIFPGLVLEGGGHITLYSRFGIDSHNILYLNRTDVWKDYGDILVLRDSDGNLILVERYE